LLEHLTDQGPVFRVAGETLDLIAHTLLMQEHGFILVDEVKVWRQTNSVAKLAEERGAVAVERGDLCARQGLDLGVEALGKLLLTVVQGNQFVAQSLSDSLAHFRRSGAGEGHDDQVLERDIGALFQQAFHHSPSQR
jgi:hypothetical protein